MSTATNVAYPSKTKSRVEPAFWAFVAQIRPEAEFWFMLGLFQAYLKMLGHVPNRLISSLALWLKFSFFS
jgi:hypothetical protein